MPDASRELLGVVGICDDPAVLERAAEKCRDAGWKHWDCHTPYPVHGLEKAMGVGDSLIPYLTVSAGLFGLAFSKVMQWYMSDFDFPLMVGGKPLFSLPAFVPVTFELFVLFAALTTFGAILVFCRLGRWNSPLHEAGVMADATGTRFVVFLDASDELFSETETPAFLKEAGCEDVRVVNRCQD